MTKLQKKTAKRILLRVSNPSSTRKYKRVGYIVNRDGTVEML